MRACASPDRSQTLRKSCARPSATIGVGTALGGSATIGFDLAPAARSQAVGVVLDTHRAARTLASCRNRRPEIPTSVIAGEAAPKAAARRLQDLGVMIERVPLDAGGHIDLHRALRALSVRGITRVFSEGGPRVAARLIALQLADAVALIAADKPLGRPGVPALDLEARAALLDRSHYDPRDTLAYGPDTVRLWERTRSR